MKEVLVRDLKEGDVFIDEDTYAMIWHHTTRITTIDKGVCVIVRCIVAPTDKETWISEERRHYLLSIDKEVLLCEEQDERDTS